MKTYKRRYILARDCNDEERRLIWDRKCETYIAHHMRLAVARRIVRLLNRDEEA
jgi:hypothetical protein